MRPVLLHRRDRQHGDARRRRILASSAKASRSHAAPSSSLRGSTPAIVNVTSLAYGPRDFRVRCDPLWSRNLMPSEQSDDASDAPRADRRRACAARRRPRTPRQLDKVSFGTNWVAEAEHGGFYQAVADGTYKKYGLDVTIVPGGPQVNNRMLLLSGKIDFFMSAQLAAELRRGGAEHPDASRSRRSSRRTRRCCSPIRARASRNSRT